MNKSNILKLSLEHVLKYLQTEFLENFCEETLFSTALAYKYNNKQIRKYRLEYEEINAKESIIEATIKKIKDEKKCLEMQNSVLKTENSSLAQIIRSHIQTNTDTNEKKTHFRINSNQIGTNLNFMANGIVDESNQRLHELVNIKNDRIETLTRELNNSDSGKIKREMEKFKELYEDQKKINAELKQKPTRKSNIINYLTFE
ncbi:hypothetical protein A3Q56_07066 [Intoshia linei]|uniref:Uncharacterized protein n=1 Tax=Intoshia linei TaxID=1819745 RepID=A0A177ATB1_9BILA|nr:hypothetical protein A3Q56_07066 [Intoshia linei]